MGGSSDRVAGGSLLASLHGPAQTGRAPDRCGHEMVRPFLAVSRLPRRSRMGEGIPAGPQNLLQREKGVLQFGPHPLSPIGKRAPKRVPCPQKPQHLPCQGVVFGAFPRPPCPLLLIPSANRGRPPFPLARGAVPFTIALIFHVCS